MDTQNRTLIVGDLHLGKGLSSGRPSIDGSLNSRVSDQVRILNWIVDTSIQNNISRLILTGDIFEEIKPDNYLVVIFMDWLYNCVSNNLEVHIVLGNHDLKRVGSRYTSVLDIIESADITNVFVYNKIYTLNTPGVSFTLVPFRDRRSLDADTVPDAIDKIKQCFPFELAEIPTNNDKVLIGHLAIEKSFFTDEIDDVSNELMVPSGIFEGYDFVWMGHVHRPQVLQKKNPYIAHIGSMDISDFGETDQQKVVILYDSTLKGKFTEIPIPTRPLRRIRLDVPKNKDATDFVITSINNMEHVTPFKNAIVKLEIKILNPEGAELDRSAIINLLKSLGSFHISGFSESRNVSVVSDEKKHITDSAIDPKAAVKLYADLLEHNDNDKNEFILLCNSIIDELSVSKKG
jgi:exonuclease SbcD